MGSGLGIAQQRPERTLQYLDRIEIREVGKQEQAIGYHLTDQDDVLLVFVVWPDCTESPDQRPAGTGPIPLGYRPGRPGICGSLDGHGSGRAIQAKRYVVVGQRGTGKGADSGPWGSRRAIWSCSF